MVDTWVWCVCVDICICITDVAPCVSASGAPWACLSTDQSILDPVVTQNSLSDSSLPVTSAPSEGGDCDGDDGPEYLAIGNLGRRNRKDSTSSAQSSEHAQISGHALEAPPPSHRRSSFSDMERGKKRSFRGHARSLSDTGIIQKHKQGKSEWPEKWTFIYQNCFCLCSSLMSLTAPKPVSWQAWELSWRRTLQYLDKFFCVLVELVTCS